ncbi:MAG: DUF2007 domain-containing protein [Gemmatimonadota bacterium]|nr:DUF2007 domain-containing protein [Gemmatimonadota bacterium]
MGRAGGPVEVARYRWRHQAEMARGVLEDAGIPATVVADDAGGAYAGIAPARLLVAGDAVEEAEAILVDLERELESDDSEGGTV